MSVLSPISLYLTLYYPYCSGAMHRDGHSIACIRIKTFWHQVAPTHCRRPVWRFKHIWSSTSNYHSMPVSYCPNCFICRSMAAKVKTPKTIQYNHKGIGRGVLMRCSSQTLTYFLFFAYTYFPFRVQQLYDDYYMWEGLSWVHACVRTCMHVLFMFIFAPQ